MPSTPGTPRAAAPFQPIDPRGREEWEIDGTRYTINSTYYLVMPGADGSAELSFIAEAEGLVAGSEITEEEAARLAAPIMTHIVEAQLDQRTLIGARDATESLPVTWIGVAVLANTLPGVNSGARTRLRRDAILTSLGTP